ncbi:MAG: hypothetical protein ACLFT0_08505 [Spirulinaceae cyanobacterium]
MSSSKQVFLHIGPPKTGSSSLQSFFNQARPELLNHGILYPQTGRPQAQESYWVQRPEGKVNITGPMTSHQFLAWTLMTEVEGLTADLCWSQVLDEIQNSDIRGVILSGEAFARLPLDSIERIRFNLKNYAVKIILYFRHPFALTLSRYTQNVKMGRYYKSFNCFIRELSDELLYPYTSILERWEKVFGRENIEVKELDSFADKFDLERDFLATVGLNPQDFAYLFTKHDIANRSPSPEVIRLLCLINKIEHSLGHSRQFQAGFQKLRGFMQSGAKPAAVLGRLSRNLSPKPLYSEQDRHFMTEAVADLYALHLGQYVKPRT